LKVLFVYPDYSINRHLDGHVTIDEGGWYSEGLASLAAVLREDGHSVELYHLTKPAPEDEFIARVMKSGPDMVAFSIFTHTFHIAEGYAAWAKQLGILTIAGGYHATLNPRETVSSPTFDFVCQGEGEVPFRTLCQRLESETDHADIPGIWCKRNGEVIGNAPGALIENLDDLPLPYFELFDRDQLISAQTSTGMAMLSRGCPYSCTYCSNHQFRSLYPNKKHYRRSRSPENSISYLRRLRESYPDMRYLRIMDDIFHYDEKWLAEFISRYKAEIGLPFASNHRVGVLTREQTKLLREAGCYQMYLGIESGSEYIRREVLKRPMTNDQLREAFGWLKEFGIRSAAYNMIGLPFEKPQHVLETIKLNAQIAPDRMFNPIFSPYPNTRLYEMAVEAGFCPPSVDYEDDVLVVMPEFPAERIAFVCAYFKLFVRVYRFANGLPGAFGRPLEKLVDRVFLRYRLPYRSLTSVGDRFNSFSLRARAFVRRRLPGLYLFLRDRGSSSR
jgi:anaerobic magnesium-protoporphyrin IX monomethyl ester cyclase